MKVKDVYHYLNTMSRWESDLMMQMMTPDLISKTTELHKKNDVIQTEQNETKVVVNYDNIHTFDEYVKLWDDLIAEKQKIYGLIEKAKAKNEISDTMLNINKSIRSLISAIKYGCDRTKPKTTIRKETGFIKGTDGVGTYSYNVEVTTTPKYDNKYYIDNLDKYTKLADGISEKIDSFNANVDIDYIPKWSIHCSFENLLDK